MVRMRTFFFVFIGGGGFLIPFLNLYYARSGMSGTQIGALVMLAALCSVVAAPLWGQLGDRSGRVGWLLFVGLLASAAAGLALGAQHGFGGFAVFTSLQSLLNAGTIPLSTTLAMLAVARYHGRGFGDIRRWGSLGWAVFVLSIGPVLQGFGLWVIFPAYALAFAVSAALLVGMPVAGLKLRRTPAAPDKPPPAAAGKADGGGKAGALDAGRLLFRTPALLVLLAAALLSGVLNAGWRQFYQIYMDQLGSPAYLIAAASMMGAAVEMPAMVWVDGWTKRYGARWALLAALALDAARLSVVLIAPSPMTILLMNAVGGVVFSLNTIGVVAYVMEHTPDRQHSTMLAIFTVTVANLIVILGAPLAGVAFDNVGAYWLYAVGVVGNILGWAVLYWGTRS